VGCGEGADARRRRSRRERSDRFR